MTKFFEAKRTEKLRNNKMLLYKGNIEKLEQLYRDRSYALVSHPNDGGFVPLVPRRMTKENWRDLFWMGVNKLVIHGVLFRSLCSACRNRFECVSKGLNNDYEFECSVIPDDLIVRL